MNLIIRNQNGMKYSFPHVEMGVYVTGAVAQPTASESDSALSPFIIYSPEGPTDKFLKFEGSTALADLVNTFGEKDWKRKGMVYDTLYDHIQANGRALVYNARTEDATVANNSILLSITPADNRTLYVDKDGKIYTVIPADASSVKSFSLNTYLFAPIFTSIEKCNSKEAIELAVKSLADIVNPSEAVIPMYTFSYIGRSKYGNNFDVVLEKSNTKLESISLYNTLIYNRATKKGVAGYTTTHGLNVYADAVPMNIADVINRFDKGRNMKVSTYEEEMEEKFNSLFITMLDNIGTQLQTLINDSLPELQNLYDFVHNLKSLYENDDTDVPAMNLINPFGQTNVPELNAIFKFPEDVVWTVSLANGSDGLLSSMKRFDYNFAVMNPEDDGGSSMYPLIDIHRNIYDGVTTSSIYDPELFRVDYILDLDFPLEIKAAIDGYVKKRPDVVYIRQYLSAIKLFEELQAQYEASHGDAINIFHFAKSFNSYNAAERKSFRIPLAKAYNKNIIDFFSNGMKTTLAGMIIDGVEEDDSVLPSTDTELQQQWLFDNNVNTITKTKLGWMINGQDGYLKNLEHPAKLLFNALIAGRIMKEVLSELSISLHFLNEPAKISEFESRVNEKIINKYKSIIDVTYKCYFANEYDEATGTLTDEITIKGSGTVKRHDLKVYLANKYNK